MALLAYGRSAAGRELLPQSLSLWDPYLAMCVAVGLRPDWRRGRNAAIETLKRSHRDQPVRLPLDELPALVAFTDVSDPMTVRAVLPTDLAPVLGAGVTIGAATLEITNAPVTRSIARSLPWLRGLLDRGATLSGDTALYRRVTPQILANHLYPEDFLRE
ncbi:hypothetical protein [Phenylobacterium sp.]|uniref:hypothetical protein n=1 Tax=Phenylobacterium sp. TaxID=1871053 RepID=UPI002ED7BFB0